MKYKVGVCQFKPQFLKPKKNLEHLTSLLSEQKADLIVLPELAISGYLFSNQKKKKKVSEDPKNGLTATCFKQLAEENNTSYVIGFAEKAASGIYNSSMLVNPDGSVHTYRKTHLFYEEKKWFKPGNTGFKVFKAKKNIKIGMMVCFDWIFPESARSLALNGAQIIAHPANLVLPWCQQAMKTRSLENRVYSITSNRTGTEKNNNNKLTFTGQSQILNPKGEIIKRFNETEEKLFITEIEPELADDKNITDYNHAFNDRRTELYNL